MKIGDTIEDNSLSIKIESILSDLKFTALLVNIKEACFKKYVKKGNSYTFESWRKEKDSQIWHVLHEEFNEEAGACQLLLYWWSDTGYSFELDF